MPNVSIIMPVYNSGKFIEKTIKSVINQTYKNWELIIIDDCSTDNSLKIIEKYMNDKFIIIKNDINMGQAISRNKAIKKASGRYIAFLDSDDIWYERKLEKQIRYMKQNEVALSFTGYERINENGIKTSEVQIPKVVDYDHFLKDTIILNSTLIIDSKTINKSLLEMPNITIGEDISMILNILRTGIKAYGINESLTKYRVRNDSVSRNKVRSAIYRWKIYKEYEKINLVKRIILMAYYVKNSIKKRAPSETFERIKDIFQFLTVKEILDFFLFIPIMAINVFTRKKIKQKKIWLISENPSQACDNGYTLFSYLRNNRKDINAYYVIKNNSEDFKKVSKLGNVISYRSLKHWLYYLNADKILITQKYSNPSPCLFYLLHIKKIIKAPRIFLQHGITINDCKTFYYNKTNFRMFICGAKKEYKYIKRSFGYPDKNVVYTGFPRFDLLYENEKKSNIILITPTWRKWIKNQKEFDIFMKKYYEFIYNTKFIEKINEKNISLVLVLHKNMGKFKINQSENYNNIKIFHNKRTNIQELIRKADMLITDYSSISMDFAYRERPIIYYQFDKTEFRIRQLPMGYYSYEKDGFGDVLEKSSEVVTKAIEYIENSFEVENKYKKRMNEFFERKDKNNCKRVVEEVEKI